MSGDQQYPPTGWGHKIREENRGLREKIAGLRKESGILERDLQNVWKLLEHIPGGLILVQQKKILFANDTVLRESGYTRNELLTMEVSKLLGSDSISFGASVREGKAGDQAISSQGEASLTTKEGHTLTVEIRTQQTLHKGKMALLVHIITLDQRKAQERYRRQSEKGEALLGMASGFSRELDVCSSLLQEAIPSSQGRGVSWDGALRILKKIEAIKEKEAILSRHLQCLAKTEYKSSELSLVDLKGLLETAVDVSRPRVSGGSQHDADPIVIKTFVRAPSEVYGCGRDLKEVFVNLILNAIEALPDGGDVYLTTEEHSGFAHIYVQDNGVGIPKAVMDRIFDPFFTTKDGTWRGLGLSLTYAIIDRHQGEISVTSQEGSGSTFVVKLPLVRDASSPVRTSAPRRGLRNSNILIIGSDGALTDILRTLFADRAGAVTVTSSYKESLRLLQDANVNLVIADHDAFRKDTGRITRRIKELRPDLSVVLINTQRASDSRTTRGSTDADLTIPRPLNLNRFLSQVAMLMGEGAPE